MSKSQQIFQNELLPAGRYWVGDLCYVMHAEWDEFCDKTFPDDDSTVEGVITLADGRKCGFMHTAYGDGCYAAHDRQGHLVASLGVDAGLIGCIRVADIDQTNPENDLTLGVVVEFPEPFRLFKDGPDDGWLHFGQQLVIKTSDDDAESDDANRW